MKKKLFKKKMVAALTAVCLMSVALTGCGSKKKDSKSLNGTLKVAGSTSMEKLCEAMSESFMEANPGVTVTVEYTGSQSAGKDRKITITGIGNYAYEKNIWNVNYTSEKLLLKQKLIKKVCKENWRTCKAQECVASFKAGQIAQRPSKQM